MVDSLHKVPLYLQIKEIIKAKIKSGEFKANAKIPTEPELGEMFQVSRVTVRRVLAELEKEGLLTKKQGKGTFVNHKHLNRKLEYVLGFSKSCIESGLTPSSILLERRVEKPTAEIAEKLNMDPSEDVIYTQRKRLADGVPIFLENNYFRLSDYRFLLDESLEDSIYDLFAERNIIPTTSVNKTLEIVSGNEKIAELMDVSVVAPFFYLDVTILDQHGKPIHVGHQLYLGEYYKFNI